VNRLSSFPPTVTPGARLLLLGSLPGVVSLARNQYYAHPQNQFWRLIGSVIDADLVPLAYDDRLAALAGAGIGLWDVIRSATRSGSLDSAIRDHQPNDLAALVARLPRLAAIGFNGGAAFKAGAPALLATGLPLLRLPSSSPAHAAMPFEAKRAAWHELRRFLIS
jgi:hypoxanthine-DNA glycosylase